MDDFDQLFTSGSDLEQIPGPEEIQRYPLYVPDEHPALFVDAETVRCWCELDEDFYIELLSPISGFQHSVPIFISECGLSDLVDCHRYKNEAVDWAMANDVTYRQPFYIELTAHFYISHTMDGDEGDCDTSYEILERNPLSDQEAAARFQEWIDRRA